MGCRMHSELELESRELKNSMKQWEKPFKASMLFSKHLPFQLQIVYLLNKPITL